MDNIPTFEPNFLNLEYFFYQFYRLITGQFFGGTGIESAWWESADWQFYWLIFRIASLLVSLLLITGISFFLVKLIRLRQEERASAFQIWQDGLSAEEEENPEWENIIRHIESDNPAEWKMAILEADKILEKMVDNMNLAGDTLGEKLRLVEPAAFNTIEDAWEAHKIRNKIAHEANFALSKREAKAVIDRFSRVFREFELI